LRIFITKSTTLTADALPPNERSSATVSLISNDSEIRLGYGVINASLAESAEFIELAEYFGYRCIDGYYREI